MANTFVKLADAAKEIPVSLRHFCRLIETHNVPVVKFGHSFKILRTKLEEFKTVYKPRSKRY